MSMLSNEFSLSATDCPDRVSVGVLRQLLYDRGFGAAEVECEDTRTAAKHLENGCGSCIRRAAFLQWTDPFLKADASRTVEALAEKIQIVEIEEDKQLRQLAAELEAELTTTGSLEGADASLRRSLVDHFARESSPADRIAAAEYIVKDLNRLLSRSEAEKEEAKHQYRQLYEAAKLTNPTLEKKTETLLFNASDPNVTSKLPPNEIYFAVLYVASLPGVLDASEIPISVKDGNLIFAPKQIFSAPFSMNRVR